MIKKILFLFLLLFLLSSCYSIKGVRPLKKGEHQFNLGLGGPILLNFDVPVIAPMLNVSYLYGVNKKWSTGFSLYLNPIGIFFLEYNSVYSLLRQKKTIPEITLVTDVSIIGSPSHGFVLYPKLGLVNSWKWGKNHLFYTGIQSLFNFYSSFVPTLDSRVVSPTLFLGNDFVFNSWVFSIQLDWIDFIYFVEGTSSTVAYLSVGGYGYLGLSLSLKKKTDFKFSK